MEPEDRALLPAIVEALLFVSPEPLSREAIHRALGGEEISEEAVDEVLDELVRRHSSEEGLGRGFELVQLAETWQFRTVAEVGPWMREFTGLQPVRLSRAALETLAIVAYRQPCTRADIERVRGVDTGGVLRALLDRRLLRVAGRREEPGRPNVYATAPRFLEVFGLGSLADLPSLREFTMLGEEDLEATEDLLSGDPGLRNQVTFDEYAARRVLADLDAAVDERLLGRTSSEDEEAEQ